MDEQVTYFGKTNFRNQEVPFGIKPDDRRRHMYIIGKTGMGKSVLLENLAIQDIQNGHGVCYIDPHGDTAEKLIKTVPPHRIKDVIYFNPADQGFPIAFNVLEKVSPEFRHLVSSGLISVFKKLWADSWGPRLEYILRNSILALLEYPDSTLLGVVRVLVDKEYSAKVVEKITDPVVKAFWVDEYPKWNERVLQEVISPIQNKVGQFLSTSLIRNIVGQVESSFSIREAMDNNKILILNMSKGRIGEDASKLLGAMMVTKIMLAAMGRVDTPEDQRKDFYLYVDEFQNFATEAFADILSEARKYKLNLTLAHQFIAQLPEEVRDAVFGNCGTLVTFRVGATDAEFLEKEFEPAFTMHDIVNLPKYTIYLKLMIDGISGDAFSAGTLPPIDIPESLENEQAVIEHTRKTYAHSKQEVEDTIAEWSGMLSSEAKLNIENIVSGNVPNIVVNKEKGTTKMAGEKPASSQSSQTQTPMMTPEEKEIFETNCAGCGIDIKVPFKPDGKRPTFCKECLKEYQRMMAKKREDQGLSPQQSRPPQSSGGGQSGGQYRQQQSDRPRPPRRDNQRSESRPPQRQESQSSGRSYSQPDNQEERKPYKRTQTSAPKAYVAPKGQTLSLSSLAAKEELKEE